LSMQINKLIIKIVWLVAAIVLCSNTAVFGLDYFGSPVPNLDPGKFSFGLSYAKSSTDLKLTGGKIKVYGNGIYSNQGPVEDFTIKSFDVTNIEAEVGYGLDYNWELFIRMGSSSCDFEHEELGKNFDGGSTPSIGAGIRTSLYEQYDFRIGVVAQANWFNYNGKLKYPGTGIPEASIDLMEIQLALGASYMLTEEFWVYGGPFYNTNRGDFNYLFDTVDSSTTISWDATWDAETTSTFGAFIGAEYKMDKNSSLTAEFQTGSGGMLFGASVVFRF
jgi:hypothetical protein